MFWIGLPSTSLDAETRLLIEEIKPGGICLFARNCKDSSEIRTLLDALTKVLGEDVFLSIDQEGGLVDRLRRIVEPMPSASDVSRKGSPDDIRRFARFTARILRILGFNMNFAPVLDIINDERRGNTNGALESRSFGNTAAEVVERAGIYAETLFEEGILPCHKHFPGIGGITIDSHEGLPEIEADRNELFSFDLVPYLELLPTNSAHAVMTGHTVFPNFDLKETDGQGRLLPTSLSGNIVTGLLRSELGFRGLALTDDMEMGAVIKNYGMAEAARLAVNAGNDGILICNSEEMIREGFRGVLEGVESGIIIPERIEESFGRIESARKLLKKPVEFDKDELARLSREIVELKKDINC
ncbi:MAG: glycoside hydrolase family 3 protein [Pyrinomonadaceae bacterium]|nr:glycoside hydrolase family 3 protein [Pyrinomonadaceae bacterium]